MNKVTDSASFSYTASLTTDDVAVVAAAGDAGIRSYVTAVQLTNSKALANSVTILDGTTELFQVDLAATVGATVEVKFPTPLKGSAATALNVQLGVGSVEAVEADPEAEPPVEGVDAVDAAVKVNIQGYQAA